MGSSANLLSSMLNYLCISLAGVWITYHLMSRVFPLRHAPYLWWAYFAVRGMVQGALVCAAELRGLAWCQDLLNVVVPLASMLSLLVMLFTWRGEYVEVALCAVVADMFAATFQALSHMFANVLVGSPLGQGWIYAIDASTAISIALTVVSTLMLQSPIIGLLRTIRRIVMHHHLAAACLVAALLVAFAVESAIPVYRWADPSLAYVEYALFPLMLGTSLLVARQARILSRREEATAICSRLVRDYDAVVREQLTRLNADRAALAGHERTLARLRGEEDDEALVERMRGLERTYRRLSSGNFCDQPALDAVITSGVRRLRETGVRCEATVAGYLPSSVEPAMMALTMLDIAGEAAERQRGRGEPTPLVELRVRGIGHQTLLHLDVPAGWGRLGARRALSVLYREGEGLVSERRRGDRTLVLAVIPEEDR